MNVEQQLKEALTSIQEIIENKIPEIANAKSKYIESQDFEEAIRLSKIETTIIEFISLADGITNFRRKEKRKKLINQVFKNQENKNMKQISKEINQELEIELIKEFGTDSSLDGILNLEEYNKTTPKILWILKEGNWGEEYLGNTDDDAKASKEDAEKHIEQKQLEMKNYYDNVPKGYSKWRATFENISYINHGIIEGVDKYDDMTNIDNEAKIDGTYYINKVAFINVKKAPGGSVADHKLISESYNKHKDFIIKQIETINPDIIINCSGVKEITTDLSNGYLLNEEFNFVKTNDRIILNMYHPAYPYRNGKSSSEEYVNKCLQIINEN
jgi:hypothetical protein